MTRASIAVVLPAYNEAITLADTLRAFHAALPEAQIWVVDNASTDDTARIARETLAALGAQGGVLSEMRKGKANAVRRAFLDIEADAYLMCDADSTYPAERARETRAPVLANEAHMVVGYRHCRRHFASRKHTPTPAGAPAARPFLVNRLFRAKLVDILSGYRAFSRRFVKTYPIIVEGFEIETDLTLHALDKRFRVRELPVEYRDRPAGSASKLNTYRDGARVLWVILQLFRYYRPLLFFGWLSLLMLVFAFAASIPVFADWFRYHYIYHVPLAILAAASVVVSTVLVAIGLILDGMAHENRRRFETALLR